MSVDSSKALYFKSKQKIRLGEHTREAVYGRIEQWWKQGRTQRVRLHKGIEACICVQPGHMILQIPLFPLFGITTWTYNYVQTSRTPDALVVYINTYKPSAILHTIWNIVITYEYVNNALKITYEKRISSCAPPGLDSLMLSLVEHQHRLDTDIVARLEAKNMLALFQTDKKIASD